MRKKFINCIDDHFFTYAFYIGRQSIQYRFFCFCFSYISISLSTYSHFLRLQQAKDDRIKSTIETKEEKIQSQNKIRRITYKS